MTLKRVIAAPFSGNDETPLRLLDPANKRVYETILFCPFVKKRPIWACFKKEPDTGSDWIRKRAIRAQYGPGWGYLRSEDWGIVPYTPR